MAKVLRYRGTGGYFPGVPMADLTDEDVAALGPDVDGQPWTAERLIESGLYARIGGNPEALAEAEHERAARVKAEARAQPQPAAEPSANVAPSGRRG